MYKAERLNILTILESIGKISEYTKRYINADDLYSNQRDVDAVIMNIIVIGEMVTRLTDEFLKEFSHIEWFQTRALYKSILANNFSSDPKEVWNIIESHLPKLKKDINVVLKKIL